MYLRLLGDAVSEEKGEENPDRDIDCLVDIHIEAHIPEDYIENLNHRLEIYRRISEIRTEEDLRDVTDELIDRFGDPPKSVLGLLTIALVRSKAEGSGIYEIKQRDGYAMMFVRNIKTLKRLGVRMFVGEFWYVGNDDWKQVIIDANDFLRDKLEQA